MARTGQRAEDGLCPLGIRFGSLIYLLLALTAAVNINRKILELSCLYLLHIIGIYIQYLAQI